MHLLIAPAIVALALLTPPDGLADKADLHGGTKAAAEAKVAGPPGPATGATTPRAVQAQVPEPAKPAAAAKAAPGKAAPGKATATDTAKAAPAGATGDAKPCEPVKPCSID